MGQEYGTQRKIDDMRNGNIIEIKNCITSDVPILIMNSILCGAKIGLNDTDYIKGVDKARSNKNVLMGIEIGTVAEAAFCFLTKTKYNGNNDTVKKLIKNQFNF